MNYFAHGLRFVGRPYLLDGTAVPDWLSVADRGVRMRAGRVEPFADSSGTIQAELAAGVLQHLHDDRWFHQTAAFYETCGELTVLFRGVVGREDGFRPGFLGHIGLEVLLDAVLIEEHPERLDAYYEALERLDPREVESAVNRMARESTSRLAPLIPLFQREQFLRDYLEPERLLYRLNQVMRRIKLNQLPADVAGVLVEAREIVRRRVPQLLPPEHFSNPRIDLHDSNTAYRNSQ